MKYLEIVTIVILCAVITLSILWIYMAFNSKKDNTLSINTGIGYIDLKSDRTVNYKYLSYVSEGIELLRIYNNGTCKIMVKSKKEFMKGMEIFAKTLWENRKGVK